MNRVIPPDRPPNDIARDRMDAILSRFRSQSAMDNAEQINGFFAALICSDPRSLLQRVIGGNLGVVRIALKPDRGLAKWFLHHFRYDQILECL